jgi:3-oxoacyl-[acyl-carrier-protein] synthase II
VTEAQWNANDLHESALIVGTSKGPIESWLPPASQSSGLSSSLSLRAEGSPQSYSFGLSEIAAHLASRLHLGFAPRLTLSTACASGLHALIRATMLLQQGHPRAIVVAAESSLHPLFISSFRRLGVIAPPQIGCRPFDQNRSGFLVSEAAAAVCLERLHAPPTANHIQIENFAMGGDAVHLTAGDPTGRTLRRLLARVIDNRPIDLIHAHGTATESNDPVELAAIESALDHCQIPPAIFSHKGALGHSLGAAGLISIVLNCLSHRNSLVPPNVRTTHPLPTTRVRLSRDAIHQPIRRSLTLASGFGGAAAVVSLVSSKKV